MKIKNKIKKGSKRAISVLLCMVMLISTFCLFDIGTFLSEAIVRHWDNTMEKSTSTGSYYDTFDAFAVPEMVYVKAGDKYSEYFLNPDTSEPTSGSGILEFQFTNAISFKITAKLKTMSFGDTSSNYITSITLGDGTSHSNGTTAGITVLESSKGLIYTTITNITFFSNESTAIKTSSAKYMIEWTVKYKTSDDREWTSVAYTGVRFPYLGQAGMATLTKIYQKNVWGSDNYYRKISTYSFLTGVDRVSGGNAKSNFTNPVSGTSYTAANLIAPLSTFSGSNNNSSAYTMPGGLNVITDACAGTVSTYFQKVANGGVFLAEQAADGSNVWYVNGYDNFTPISVSTPDYASYGNSNGYGIGYLTVDTSRFKDFADVPNLQTGWASFGRNNTNEWIFIQNIFNAAYTDGDAGGSQSVEYEDYWGDTTWWATYSYIHHTSAANTDKTKDARPNHTQATLFSDVEVGFFNNPSQGASITRGLYPITGKTEDMSKAISGTNAQYDTGITGADGEVKIPEDRDFEPVTGNIVKSAGNNSYTTYLRYEYDDYMTNYNEHSGVTAVGFNVTPVSKSSARADLKRLLLYGINKEGSGSYWNDYILPYIQYLSKYLGDSEATDVGTSPTWSKVEEAAGKCSTYMTAATMGSLYFKVPESIYLFASTSTTSEFQYELDSTPTRNGNTVTYTLNKPYCEYYKTTGMSESIPDVSYGSIYFYYPNAINITITCNSEASGDFSDLSLGAESGYGVVSNNKTGSAGGSTYKYSTITTTSSNEIKGRINSGISDYHEGANWNLQWEAKFFDTSDNLWKTTKAITKVYSPYLGSAAASAKARGLKNGLLWAHSEINVYGTAWITGIQGVSGGDDRYKFAPYTGYTISPTETVSITGSGRVYDSDWVYGNRGPSNVNVTGGTAYLYLDKDRFSNYNFDVIPNLRFGLDINSATSDDDNNAQTDSLYLDGENLYAESLEAGSHSGTRIFDSKDLEDGIGISLGTTSRTVNITATVASRKEKCSCNDNLTIPISLVFYDKKELRNEVNACMADAAVIQPYFYTKNSTAFNKYEAVLLAAHEALGFIGNIQVVATWKDSNGATQTATYTDLATLKSALKGCHDDLFSTNTSTSTRATGCTAKQYNVFLKNDPNNAGKYIIANAIFSNGSEDSTYVLSKTYKAYDRIQFAPGDVNGDPYENYEKCLGCLVLDHALTNSNNPYTLNKNNFTPSMQSKSDESNTDERFDGAKYSYEDSVLDYRHAKRCALNTSAQTEIGGYYVVYFYIVNQYTTYFDSNDKDYNGITIPVNLFSVNKYNANTDMFGTNQTHESNKGITSTYDPVNNIITLSGTTSDTAFICEMPMLNPFKRGLYLKITPVGGSVSGQSASKSCFVFEYLRKDYTSTSEEQRIKTDIFLNSSYLGVARTFPENNKYSPDDSHKLISLRYYSSGSSTTFINYQIRVELAETQPSNFDYAPFAVVKNYKETITKGTYPVPVRSGFDFLGWYTDPECTTLQFDPQSSASQPYTVEHDSTLYAKWKAHVHDVLFDNLFDFDTQIKTTAGTSNIYDINAYKSVESRPSDKHFNMISFRFNDPPAGQTDSGGFISTSEMIEVKPGHTYRVRYFFNCAQPALRRMTFMVYDQNKTWNSTYYKEEIGIKTSATSNYYEETWTAPSTGSKWYVAFRPGVKNVAGQPDANRYAEYGDISLQDITDPNDLTNTFTSEPYLESNDKALHTAEFTCGKTLGESMAYIDYNVLALSDELPTMTRDGYKFNGWLDENNEPVTAATQARVDGTLSLHSDWVQSAYNVYVDPGINGAKVGAMSYIQEGTTGTQQVSGFTKSDSKKTEYLSKVVYGKTITIGSLTAPSDDYIFIGWSLSVDSKDRDDSYRTAMWDYSVTADGKMSHYCMKETDSEYCRGNFGLAGDKRTIYLKNLSPTAGTDVTIVANWYNIKEAKDTSSALDGISEITYGYSFAGTPAALTKTMSDYFGKNYDDYSEAKSDFDTALSAWNSGTDRTPDKLKKLIYNDNSFENTIKSAYSQFKDKTVVSVYLDSFTVKRSNSKTMTDEGSVKNINLNYYSYDTLDEIKTNYDAANELVSLKLSDSVTVDGKSVKAQNYMNTCIANLAKNYAEYDDSSPKTDEAAPNFVMYDKTKDAQSIESSVDETPNYVYPEYKGDGTYYCYTNCLKPTVVLTVDEIPDTEKSSRVSYPTKSTISSNNETTFKHSAKNTAVANTEYDDYLESNVGKEYNTTLKEDYYKQKSMVVLKPEFNKTGDKTEAVYTITSTDDANTATTNNKASQSKKYNSSKNDLQNNLTDGTITVYICYHNTQFDSSDNFYGDNESSLHSFTKSEYNGYDSWCNQYRVYRTSGGASNWEYPKEADTIYSMYDKTFDTYTTCGSFIYVFTEAEANSFGFDKSFEWGENGQYALNSVKDKLIKYFKDNVSGASTDKFGKQLVWNEQGSTGYMNWLGSKWNLYFYPNAGHYVYTHLIDRWGNVHNAVFQIGQKVDTKSPQLSSFDNEIFELTEDGGSGVNNVTVNGLSSFNIITDANSTFVNNVYTTTGDTIKLSTGQPNKEFKLKVTDIATNETDASVKTNSDGVIELKVNDLAYAFDKDAYTFTLNGKQINLFAGVTKHILSAEGSEVPEGSVGTITVRTSADVGKVQMVDSKGDTKTITEWDSQVGNVKTWTLTRTLNPGEYEFKIRAKIGNKTWLDEYLTATITVTTIINDTGKILDVTYPLSKNIENTFTVKVDGRARKIQFVDEKNHTWTFERHTQNVQSIVSYDADGNVIDSTARILAYEVWTIDADLKKGKYTAIGKFGNGWLKEEGDVFPFEIVFAD